MCIQFSNVIFGTFRMIEYGWKRIESLFVTFIDGNLSLSFFMVY